MKESGYRSLQDDGMEKKYPMSNAKPWCVMIYGDLGSLVLRPCRWVSTQSRNQGLKRGMHVYVLGLWSGWRTGECIFFWIGYPEEETSNNICPFCLFQVFVEWYSLGSAKGRASIEGQGMERWAATVLRWRGPHRRRETAADPALYGSSIGTLRKHQLQ